MPNSKILLINGGMRVGDTFHLIPWFYKHQDVDIDWVTGSYESEAAYFIQAQYPNIKNIFIENDNFPGTLSDRLNFSNTHKDKYTNTLYTDIIYNHEISLDTNDVFWDTSASSIYLENIKPFIFPEKKEYIVIHTASVSDWKNIQVLNQLDFTKYNVYHICDAHKQLPNTVAFNSKNLNEIASLIKGSRLFVGIHSSLACLTLYLDKSAVIVHFGEGFLNFNKYNFKMLDIVTPTKEKLESVVREAYENCASINE